DEGGYRCACAGDFVGQREACPQAPEPAPSCSTLTCGEHAHCMNASADEKAQCSCDDGYAGDGMTCSDVDECEKDNGGCGDATFTRCMNEPGGAPSCTDIDECANDNGGCGNATFTRCSDKKGAAPGCTDIDECANDNGGCGDPARWTCTN